MTPSPSSTSLPDDAPGTPPGGQALAGAIDEVTPLFKRLSALRHEHGTMVADELALNGIYTRCLGIIDALRPALATLSLPIPRRNRQTVRSLLELLRVLADESWSVVGIETPQESRLSAAVALWRCMHALTLHLLVSNLAAAPAGIGIWLQLHQAYVLARERGLDQWRPEGARGTFQHHYMAAILLGCAQPASFTSREIDFAASYLDRFAECVAFGHDHENSTDDIAAFWIDPTRDAPAVPYSRKPSPADVPFLRFSCHALATQIKRHLESLGRGAPARTLGLPEFAESSAGQGVLRRLAGYLGQPGKRRFPRRRQNYRAELCTGLDNLWRLFQPDAQPPADPSSWMVTNESPDGCAIMHVIGRTGDVSVGDIVALRAEGGTNWQIAIIRWAQSENPEHLEFGLQILAARAVPAMLVRRTGDAPPSSDDVQGHILLLQTPLALTRAEMLVTPSGFVTGQSTQLVLVIEQGNIEIREVSDWQVEEQNGRIEVLSINLPEEDV